jgi:hypothetical protein
VCHNSSVDSTGIKVANRGEWIRDKWQKKKKRGYIKIHVAVNTKTKQIIISMIVTKEKVSDGRMLKPLVKQVPSTNVDKAIADGVYTIQKTTFGS